jgi:hypothetical protein
MAEVCDGLPEVRHKQCYAIGAGTILEEDRSKVTESVLFCGRATQKEVAESCYERLMQTAPFNFHQDSPEAAALCEALPGPWRERCLGRL